LKRIIIIGATGSIGRQTLDIVSKHPDLFKISAVSAHRDEQGLLEISRMYPNVALCLSGLKPESSSIKYTGHDGLISIIEDSDAHIVVNAAAGAAGMELSFTALRSGKDLALANKETIVMAGRLALNAATEANKKILPVDSEHSAIFNMIERFGRHSVRGVVITASGGAFRDVSLDKLTSVTPKEALAHPTWNMGAKITIDSASMANKGLEVIEAARLFKLSPWEIEVVIHPESRVHSFIRTRDGSLYAQMSLPDMRIPILNALTWPEMVDESIADMKLSNFQLRFYDPDPIRYPMLNLAYAALKEGEGSTNAYNAANEIAVEAFMDGRIGFMEISRIVEKTLQFGFQSRLDDLDAVQEVDKQARIIASKILREN
jgi:1-deoxy-D-xylulose-5-phosphate reductoisomerase